MSPEKLSQNIFDYNNVILPAEKDMIRRKIANKKVGGAMPTMSTDSFRDLQLFFNMHNNLDRESHLNYFLVKKWLGKEYKRKRRNNPMALVYLSVDFYYSIYVVKTNKKGKKMAELKACFPAEKSEIKARPLEKIIEISYVDKGLLWDSKKKIILEFNGKQIDEFALHHQQARILFGSSPKFTKKPEKGHQVLHQSSIVTRGGYQDATMGTKSLGTGFKKKPKATTILESNLIEEPSKKLNTSMNQLNDSKEDEYNLDETDFQQQTMNYNSNPNRNAQFTFDKYDDNLDAFEKHYVSEKMIDMQDMIGFSPNNREFDEDMLEQLKQEINMFKKKVEKYENISEEEDDGTNN